jgi:hypothetical protein
MSPSKRSKHGAIEPSEQAYVDVFGGNGIDMTEVSIHVYEDKTFSSYNRAFFTTYHYHLHYKGDVIWRLETMHQVDENSAGGLMANCKLAKGRLLVKVVTKKGKGWLPGKTKEKLDYDVAAIVRESAAGFQLEALEKEGDAMEEIEAEREDAAILEMGEIEVGDQSVSDVSDQSEFSDQSDQSEVSDQSDQSEFSGQSDQSEVSGQSDQSDGIYASDEDGSSDESGYVKTEASDFEKKQNKVRTRYFQIPGSIPCVSAY